MENYSICRICLAQDIHMRLIVNTKLQDMYEFLTNMPLETKDFRPTMVCYICCARLKNCYDLRKTCLQSEEKLTQILEGNVVPNLLTSIQESFNAKRFKIEKAVLLSMGHEPQKEAISEGVNEAHTNAFFNVEVKMEQTEEASGSGNKVESYEPKSKHSLHSEEVNVKIEPNDDKITIEDLDGLEEEVVDDYTQSTDYKYDPLRIVKTELVDDIPTDDLEENTAIDYSQSTNTKYSALAAVKRNLVDGCASDKHNKKTKPVSQIYPGAGGSTINNVEKKIKEKNKKEMIYIDIDTNNYTVKTSNNVKQNNCKTVDISARIQEIYKTAFADKTTEEKQTASITSLEENKKDKIAIPIINKPKSFSCNGCQKSFTNIDDFEHHTCIQIDRKRHQCNICSKKFSKYSILTGHMRIHTGEKPYQCSVCTKCFSQRAHLNSHSLIHTGERPYECNVCKKTFLKKYNLTKHNRIHTGEKPYQCNVCQASFIRKDHLHLHQTRARHVSN